MDPALQADLGGAALPGLDGAPGDLVDAQEVGGAAEVLGELALGEGAEAAAEVADVGVVDVPADDVGDAVTGALDAVGGRRRRRAARPPARGPTAGPSHRPRRAALRPRPARARARIAVETPPTGCGRRPPRHAGGGSGTVPVAQRSRRARPRPSEAASDGPRVPSESHVSGSARKRGYTARRGSSVRPAAAQAASRRATSGHGASGFTWSGVTGETPPKSSMPAASSAGKSSPERLGGACTETSRRQQEARDGDRPEVVVERRLVRVRHLRVGLRAEVLDDHLLQVPVLEMQVAQRDQRLDALAPGLADPDQDAAGVRDAQPPGPCDRVDADGGILVGRAEVGATARRQAIRRRLEHDPLRGADLAERRELVVVEHAGVRVRQQPGLAQHRSSDVGEVGGGRREPECGELVPRGAIAQLRLVAEREEGLAAPGLGSLARDRERLVDGQVGALSPSRRSRERAVVAHVAAQHRERDEDLRRVRDVDAVLVLAHLSGGGEQLVEALLERLVGEGEGVRVVKHPRNRTRVHYWTRSRSLGARSRAKRRRNPSWSAPGAWKTRWWNPSSRYARIRSTASSGSEVTMKRDGARSRCSSAIRSSSTGIVDALLHLGGQRERRPERTVAARLLDVRVVAELHLEHQLEVVERAAIALGAGRHCRKERVGVQLARFARRRDEPVAGLSDVVRRLRRRGGDPDRHRRLGLVVDRRAERPVVLALERHAILAPELADQRDRLLEPGQPLTAPGPLDAGRRHLVQRLSRPDAEEHTTRARDSRAWRTCAPPRPAGSGTSACRRSCRS